MSILLLLKLFFLFLYIGLSALITFVVYKEEKQFYEPIFVTKKSKKEGELEEKVNIHDEFDEFTKRDEPINFITLFIGILTIFWFKVIIGLSLSYYHALDIYKIAKKKEKENSQLTKEESEYIITRTSFLTNIFLKISGIFVDYKRLPDEKVSQVYKKYFGPDHKINYEGKFGCYISNHTCIYDMPLAMTYFGCGFVAKEAVKKVPIFGKLSIGLHSILVDRSSTGAKKDVLELIVERQKEYMEGKPVIPLMIFPEGTTTSSRHILRFKKGAFHGLYPVKATIIHPNLDKKYHLGCGASNAAFNYIRSLAKLYNKIEYIELPIMTPNEYMYTNFASYGKEKWEIYAEVAREIMCELGNFKKSEMGLRDSYRYCSCINEKKLLDRDTYKIKSE